MQQMSNVTAGTTTGETRGAGGSYRFRFHGTGNAFFALILKNLLITLVTCGIYAAWAKTERRKFIWQNTEFHGQRLLYRGTGEELFIGYLKVAGGYAVFVGLPMIAKVFSEVAYYVLQGVLVLGILFLIPFAVYWSRAYLLSRTSWRGVSFSLQPGAKEFAKAFIVGYLLTLVTLGLYAPIWINRMYTISMNRTSFGNMPFRYDGRDGEVWKMTLKGWLLSLVTLGIYYPWFLAELGRYRAEHTYLGGARARSTLEGAELFKLTLIYVFGTTLTLGLAFPWIVCYALDTVLQRMTFEGEIDFAQISKAPAVGNAVGDGLADAMDLGLSL
jgi:uncharacterized membrane protein YjgN (DUF898 family)